MNYATNIAVLNEDGFVENIIWGMIYQLDEFNSTYPAAVVIDDYDITIGDQYVDGEWYRAGEKIDMRTNAEKMGEVEMILDMLYEGTEVTDE